MKNSSSSFRYKRQRRKKLLLEVQNIVDKDAFSSCFYVVACSLLPPAIGNIPRTLCMLTGISPWKKTTFMSPNFLPLFTQHDTPIAYGCGEAALNQQFCFKQSNSVLILTSTTRVRNRSFIPPERHES